ncbi:MAG: pantoate--beta-alanine ligase [Ignavibacteriaceae bacterium]
MKTITGIKQMHQLSSKLKAEGKVIGFVPTMGFLHEGHLSLIKKSKQKSDVTVVSILVNPTQFAPTEDLEKYPRDLKHDKNLLTKNGVDFLFFPDASEIYQPGYQTFVEVNEITQQLEGKFRPNHFKGVATVVSILFNCIKPDFAFFGQKDAQQAAVVKQMIKDLKYDLDIVLCPIVREKDGLAMSSRNIYLSGKERKDALVLSRALKLAEKLIINGERLTGIIISKMIDEINSVDSSKIDYVRIVDAEKFYPVDNLTSGGKYFALIACKVGNTRLIDNTILKVL